MSKGKAYVIENTGDYLRFLLYDYDIGSPYLKPVHKSWLDKYVIAPWAYKSVQVELTGYASKGRNTEWNRVTAYNRASCAVNYLVNRGNIPIDYITTDDPNLQEDDDPLQEEGWRAVLVEVWYN
jgi:hypothetical protein